MKKYTKKTKEKFYVDIAKNLLRGCDSAITPLPKTWTHLEEFHSRNFVHNGKIQVQIQ